MRIYLLLSVLFLVSSAVIAGKLAGKFVRKSLDVQFNIAVEVSKVLSCSIVLFTEDKLKFKDAAVLTVNNYRYLKAKTGEIGVLSVAEFFWEIFTSTNTFLQYLGDRSRVKLNGQDVVLEKAWREQGLGGG